MGHFEVAALKILVVLSQWYPHADFFTVRKTEEIQTCDSQEYSSYYNTWKIFGGKDCHVWGGWWCEETSSFLLIMWQHVVDEEGWRLHVIDHLSGDLCSLVSRTHFIVWFTRQCFNGCLLCGDRTSCWRCFGKKGSQHSCLVTQSKEANICASIMETQTKLI